MRTLGIDYGTARVGLALSDEFGILASPYRTLAYSKEILREIADVVREQEVGTVVLGIPYDLNGAVTESTKRTMAFAEKLREVLPCPVIEMDEALSSRRAVQKMVEAGVKKSKRRNKENTDAWAAAIILQEFLDGQ